VKAVLERDLRTDLPRIAGGDVDALLTLNAGYSPLSYLQDRPVFSYCHGNDFLSPWIPSLQSHEGAMVGLLGRTPYLRRYAPRIQRTVFRRRVARGLRHARHIFVNSEYTKQRLRGEYPGIRRPVSVAPPGVPDVFFRRDRQAGEPGGSDGICRFLTIARLASVAKKKNVDNILRALALLRDEIPFEYRIIGDGDLREALKGLAHELGLRERVSFLGELDSRDVIRWLDASDLFVLPSKASPWDVESFGIVYVEAAARGVPSLLSRAGGATDAVLDGVSGIVIDHSDPASIADGIRHFFRCRDQFRPARITAFATRFRWDSVSRDMWAVISGEAGGEQTSLNPDPTATSAVPRQPARDPSRPGGPE
jgi:phosphatidylinositol alpha-1,6-mannosyltransferase